jgi:serine/threonine protein kinase
MHGIRPAPRPIQTASLTGKFADTMRGTLQEYADETLKQYIISNNTILTNDERKSIVSQVLKAISYINDNGLLHRDISLNNILIKKYDKLVVVKLSDFGLVKFPESQLTSELSELKGSLNDPDLQVQGFDKYNVIHETYALTRLIYFVMTGKINIQKIENESLEKFIMKGINKETKKRFQSINELKNAFNSLKL